MRWPLGGPAAGICGPASAASLNRVAQISPDDPEIVVPNSALLNRKRLRVRLGCSIQVALLERSRARVEGRLRRDFLRVERGGRGGGGHGGASVCAPERCTVSVVGKGRLAPLDGRARGLATTALRWAARASTSRGRANRDMGEDNLEELLAQTAPMLLPTLLRPAVRTLATPRAVRTLARALSTESRAKIDEVRLARIGLADPRRPSPRRPSSCS